MEFLISQGHSHANRYPLVKVWSESEITRRRMKAQEAYRMTNDQLVHAAIHGGKKGQALLKRTLKGMTDGGST